MQTAGEVTKDSLKGMIVATSQALAAVDADRLEALLSSFRVLVYADGRPQEFAHGKVGGLQFELNLLARLIDVTRANLHVLRRADVSAGQSTGYGPEASSYWKTRGRMYGNN